MGQIGYSPEGQTFEVAENKTHMQSCRLFLCRKDSFATIQFLKFATAYNETNLEVDKEDDDPEVDQSVRCRDEVCLLVQHKDY